MSNILITIGVDVFLATTWCFTGFMWGRLYEHKNNLHKKLLENAMDGWEQTEKQLLELINWMREQGIVRMPDGSIKSPYQLKDDV